MFGRQHQTWKKRIDLAFTVAGTDRKENAA